MNSFGEILIDNLLNMDDAQALFLFKALKDDVFGQTVAALANGTGGDIIVGITDDKRVLGLELDAGAVAEKCMQIVRKDVSSNLPVNIQVIHYDGKDVILVSVWEGQKKPYLYKDDFYVRVGDVIKRASVKQINSLITESSKADDNWERQVIPTADMDDLDLDEVCKTIESAYNKIRMGEGEREPEAFLVRQGLIRQGLVTNACMMLFGKFPMKFIPQAAIRLSIYSDNEQRQLINTKIYVEGVFRNLYRIFDDFKEIFGTHLSIQGLERKDMEAYPQVALREAVMNAVIHRDMSKQDSFITINVFASKTEISNSGELMGGVTTSALKRQHNSVLRNPDMAYLCYLRGLMELAGSGTLRIIEDCRANGFKEPVWTSKSNVVRVVFPAISPRLNTGTGTRTMTERMAVSVSRENDLQDIVAYIRKHPHANTVEIHEAINNKSMATLKRNLAFLKSTGIISYEGNNRNGGYVVNED